MADTKPNPLSLILSSIPRATYTGDALGNQINIELAWRLEAISGLAISDPLSPGQETVLDNLILTQTETLGSLALASSKVRDRVQVWREDVKDGGKKLERFGKALYTAWRIHHHFELPPIDPTMKEKKEAFKTELKVVLRYIEQAQNRSRSVLTLTEIQELFEAAIPDPERSLLYPNIASWLAFIAARLDDFRANLKKPAALFDLWLAFWTGYKIEALRQKISELP